MTDPITELAARLFTGQPPTQEWIDQWAPDGDLTRAWRESCDGRAMAAIVDRSLCAADLLEQIDAEGEALIPVTKLAIGPTPYLFTVWVDSESRVAKIETVTVLESYHSDHRWTAIAERLRPIGPPSFAALLRRFGVT
jgi:hypothetical protein